MPLTSGVGGRFQIKGLAAESAAGSPPKWAEPSESGGEGGPKSADEALDDARDTCRPKGQLGCGGEAMAEKSAAVRAKAMPGFAVRQRVAKAIMQGFRASGAALPGLSFRSGGFR